MGGPLVRVVAAGVAAVLVHRAWVTARGRERHVGWWIIVAGMAWFISELERLVAAGIGRPSLLADLGILGFVAAAVGMFVAAARHRLRPADEAGLYLDAIAIFGATTGR